MKIKRIISQIQVISKSFTLYSYVNDFKNILYRGGDNEGVINGGIFIDAVNSLPENVRNNLNFWEMIAKINGLEIERMQENLFGRRHLYSIFNENQLNDAIAIYLSSNKEIQNERSGVKFNNLMLDMLKMRFSSSVSKLLDSDMVLNNELLLKKLFNIIKKNPEVMNILDNKIKNNRKVALCYVKHAEKPYIQFDFNDDLEIMSHLIKKRSKFIEEASENVRSNEKVAEMAIRDNINNLEYVGKELFRDKKFALKALKISARAFDFLDQDLQKDRDVIIQALKKSSEIFGKLDEELKNDKELAKLALSKKGALLSEMTDEIKNDFSLAKIAILNDASSYMFIGEILKSNKELLLLAIEKEHFKLDSMQSYIRYSNLGDDKNLILFLTKKYKTNLFSCVSSLADDKDFVLKYMQNYDVYVRVSTNLRLDNEVISLALTHSYENLKYLPYTEDMDKCIEIIDKAFRKKSENLKYVLNKITEGDIPFEELMEKNSQIGVFLVKNLESIQRSIPVIPTRFYIKLLRHTGNKDIYLKSTTSVMNSFGVVMELVKLDIRNFKYVPPKIYQNVDFMKKYKDEIKEHKEELAEMYKVVEPFVREDFLNEELSKIDKNKSDNSNKRRKI